MFQIQFITDKEKLENLWFLKYHKKSEENIFSETENFCREVETKWKEKEVIILSLFKKITRLEFDRDFTVFVFHPKLEMAEYKDFESRVSSMSKNEFQELKNAVSKFYGISQ